MNDLLSIDCVMMCRNEFSKHAGPKLNLKKNKGNMAWGIKRVRLKNLWKNYMDWKSCQMSWHVHRSQ